MIRPLITADEERTLLEHCLSECKRRLNQYRAAGNEMLADMAQADLDRMLDELKPMYERLRLTKSK